MIVAWMIVAWMIVAWMIVAAREPIFAAGQAVASGDGQV